LAKSSDSTASACGDLTELLFVVLIIEYSAGSFFGCCDTCPKPHVISLRKEADIIFFCFAVEAKLISNCKEEQLASSYKRRNKHYYKFESYDFSAFDK
jgi:hypothetical protein